MSSITSVRSATSCRFLTKLDEGGGVTPVEPDLPTTIDGDNETGDDRLAVRWSSLVFADEMSEIVEGRGVDGRREKD